MVDRLLSATRFRTSIRAAGPSYIFVLFVVAVAVRCAVGGVVLSRGPDSFVSASDDGDAYDAAARWEAFGDPIIMTERLAQKWGVDATVASRWPQGYWLFLAGQYRLLGSMYLSTVVLQALIGGAGVLAAYALAKSVMHERAARLAGGAVALSSTGIVLSATLYAESLYIPLLSVGLAMVAAAHQPGLSRRANWVWLASGGAAFALAEVVRPLALPVFLIAAMWCALPFDSHTRRARIVMLLVLSAGFLLSIAPFLVRDLAISGRITTFTVGGAEAFHDQGSDLLGQKFAALGADPYATGALHAAIAILAHPLDTLRAAMTSVPERISVMFMSGWAPLGEPVISPLDSSSYWVRLAQWVLATVGAVWVLSSARRRPVGLLLGLAILAIVGPSLVLGLPLVRYRASADPLFIVAMVGGLGALVGGLGTIRGLRRKRTTLRTVLAAAQG